MTKWHEDDHMERGINLVFDNLLLRFNETDANGDHISLDDSVKLASSIGYISQVKTGMDKNVNIRNEIRAIKSYLSHIPPEIIASLTTPELLVQNADLK